MDKIFNFETLEQTEIECEECGWVGKGYETQKIYIGLPADIELYCPVCGNYLGLVVKQAD